MNHLSRLLVVGSTLLLFAGCSSGKLSGDGQKVKVMKADPPANCTELKVVSNSPVAFCDENCARNKIRNEAAEAGANYLRLDSTGMTGGSPVMSGTAFKCP